MSESFIDLDVPEPVADPPSPRSRRPLVFAVVGLLLAGVAAYGLLTRPPGPPEIATLVDAAPLWTVDVDDDLGEPHVATFAGDTVLVTAQRGLVAYDRATGAQKWRLRLQDLIGSSFDVQVNQDAAVGLATVFGDAVLLDMQWVLEADSPAYHVLAAATGEVRFTLKPRAASQWFDARMTSAGLVSVDCDIENCLLRAQSLADGSELWRWTGGSDMSEVVWPSRLVGWEHHDSGTPIQPEEAAVDTVPSYVLVHNYLNVESVDIATGETLGRWEDVDGVAGGFVLAGDALLNPEPTRLQRLDPATGEELWEVDTLDDLSLNWMSGLLMSGGKVLDSTADGSRTRWIDLADGTTGPEFAGEHPVVVGSGMGVTTGPDGMSGIDLHTGDIVWRTPMRATPWDVFRERNAYADESWLVLDGRLGVEQRSPRWFAAVNLSTGFVRGFTGASVIGYGGGQVLTMSFPWERPTEYTVGLVGL